VLTPFRMVFVAGGLASLFCAYAYGTRFLIVVGMLGSVVGAMGPETRTVLIRAERTGVWIRDLLPRTVMQWGVLGVVAAFILLGLGAAFTLTSRTTIKGS